MHRHFHIYQKVEYLPATTVGSVKYNMNKYLPIVGQLWDQVSKIRYAHDWHRSNTDKRPHYARVRYTMNGDATILISEL